MTKSEIIRKYNVAGPRYTSYPTVPFWTDSPTQEQWLNCVNQQIAKLNFSNPFRNYT